jgi:NADPH:quinone reductase-like Zn-dependent oxidoreductase
MPKAIYVEDIPGARPGKVYLPLKVREVPKPRPGQRQLLVRITAVSLNHRDLFIRQLLYPGISFDTPLLADGCGVVEAVGMAADRSWIGRRVIANPGIGWKSALDGPEEEGGYKTMGATKKNPLGTLQEWLVIDEAEVEEAPVHLTDVQAACLPLTGLTAWRATLIKTGTENVTPGKNVLITGIGGGVALMALLFGLAKGANIWVTSGSQDKLDKAVQLGARGGVNYREKEWEKKLMQQLGPEKRFDAIIDGAGGDIVEKSITLLKVRPGIQVTDMVGSIFIFTVV